jgi:hypothetical protein
MSLKYNIHHALLSKAISNFPTLQVFVFNPTGAMFQNCVANRASPRAMLININALCSVFSLLHVVWKNKILPRVFLYSYNIIILFLSAAGALNYPWKTKESDFITAIPTNPNPARIFDLDWEKVTVHRIIRRIMHTYTCLRNLGCLLF